MPPRRPPRNLGTLYPSADLGSATIAGAKVPARCGERGLLLIGTPPEVGPYVLPGNNYHVYDYSLFWANVRADAARRLDHVCGVITTDRAAFRAVLPDVAGDCSGSTSARRRSAPHCAMRAGASPAPPP